MDFEVAPEPQQLIDSVRSVLAQQCPPALVRGVVENGGAPEQPWKSARELGWTAIDPGPRRRLDALARRGRETVGMALGLLVVLLISGMIEAFVTPSGLPTWARIGIGLLAELIFLGYAFGLGRRAVRAGEVGDITALERGDAAPTAH